jgi:hypothetical protein
MRIDHYLPIMGLVLVVGLSMPQIFAQSNSFIYTNPDYGITMAYPSDWDIEETDEGHTVAFFSPLESISDTRPEMLSVATEDLKPCRGTTLEEYVQESSDYLVEYKPNMQPIGEIKPFIVNGMPAYTRTYVSGYGSDEVRSTQFITVQHNTAYVITYGRFEYDQQFLSSLANSMEMIGSLIIEPGQFTGSNLPAQEGVFTPVKHDPSAKCGSASAAGSNITPY